MTLLLLTLLVTLLAAGALLSDTSFWQRASLKPAFRIGAPVVYRQQEVSTHPAADACDVHPSERGEYYYYTVINYLRVAEVMATAELLRSRAITNASASGLTTPVCGRPA